MGAAAVAAAALWSPAAAHAVGGSELRELVRAREAVAQRAAAASASTSVRVSRAERRARLSAVAARRGPARVVIGLRSAADAPAVEAIARRHGRRVARLGGPAAITVTARSPRALAEALADRPEAAYAEPIVRRTWLSHDETFDHTHGGGLPFAWAFGNGPGFVGVNAAPALDAAGGRSDFPVAVLDSGIDATHPALSLADSFNAVRFDPEGGADRVGHGTFVAGLVAARGGARALRGTAGGTALIGVKVGTAGGIESSDLAHGITGAVNRGARVLNVSLGGPGLTGIERDALTDAFDRDVLVVAAAGNDGESGNQVIYPAAYIGGHRGETGLGLSVAATRPSGAPAGFSTHNDAVSVAAPGASAEVGACVAHGVYSTLSDTSLLWDDPESCSQVFADPTGRYAYSEGTSMSSPLVAGLAATVWMANRELASDQVADVINRTAHQTVGTGWNHFTGNGVVDGGAASAFARTYDTRPPRSSMRARRRGRRRDRVRVTARGTDRADAGDVLAGGVDVELYTSVDRRNWRRYAGPRPRRITRTIRLPKRGRLWIQALVCDANLNCAVRQRGPFKRRRR